MSINANHKIKKQTGMMLIEIMMAVALSVLLLALLLETYLTYQRQYQLQKTYRLLQHHAKSVIELFRTEIHRAGSVGCARLTSDFIIREYGQYSLSSSNKISINSSEFTVRYAAPEKSILPEDMQHKVSLYVDNNIKRYPGDVLLIANCFQAEIFVVAKTYTERGMQKVIPVNPLHELYSQSAEVSALAMNRYYLAASRADKQNSTMSLYQENIHHRKTELITGINHLTIEPDLAGLQISFAVSVATAHKTWHTYVALRGVNDDNDA